MSVSKFEMSVFQFHDVVLSKAKDLAFCPQRLTLIGEQAACRLPSRILGPRVVFSRCRPARLSFHARESPPQFPARGRARGGLPQAEPAAWNDSAPHAGKTSVRRAEVPPRRPAASLL